MTLRGPASQVGATFRDLRGELTQGDTGARVVAIEAKGPAATAGIRTGDIVTEFDGVSVRNARALTRLVGETPPGRAVSVTVARDGRVRLFRVTPTLGQSVDN
jgi:S1-C subfamily serine protease